MRSSILKKYFWVSMGSIPVMALMILPVSRKMQWFWPEWLSLYIVYWVIKKPKVMHLGLAWFLGLTMDLLAGSILGQHALAMSLVAYLSNLLRSKLKPFPIWLNAISIFIIIGFSQLVVLLIDKISQNNTSGLLFWGSSLSSVLIWPILVLVLNNFKFK